MTGKQISVATEVTITIVTAMIIAMAPTAIAMTMYGDTSGEISITSVSAEIPTATIIVTGTIAATEIARIDEEPVGRMATMKS